VKIDPARTGTGPARLSEYPREKSGEAGGLDYNVVTAAPVPILQEASMQTFNWNNELETGNGLIDQEHRQIIRIYNDCVELARNGPGAAQQLVARLNEFMDKVASHFRTEEIIAGCILANSAGQEKLARHKAQHDNMLAYLKAAIPKLAANDSDADAIKQLLEHIYDWYSIHIEKEDKDFAVHVKRRFAS
jgi:hemerythrin